MSLPPFDSYGGAALGGGDMGEREGSD